MRYAHFFPLLAPKQFQVKFESATYTYLSKKLPLILHKRHACLFPRFIDQTMFQNTEWCVTPKNSTGQCVPIDTCPEVMIMLKSRPLTPKGGDYLKAAHCGFHGPKLPKICCAFNTVHSTVPTTGIGLARSTPSQESSQRLVAEKNRLKVILVSLLPDDECGVSAASKIFNGSAVGLFDFPWMALIEYETPNGNYFKCGGSLISKRYVLTAAHCVNEDNIPPGSKPASVRLGEYDLATDIDCDYDYVCSDDPVDVPIAEILMHERYNSHDGNRYHDIALLKLARDVDFTDFIKPICLPYTTDLISQSFAGTIGTIVGWGKTEYDSSGSTVKLSVELPVKSHEECTHIYNKIMIVPSEGQICAGGEQNKDSCEGDSGGPLMTLHEESALWYITGIISFGAEKCGSLGWPGIYTRVTEYVPWIIGKFLNL
uniref:CLIP domain-containing serine protease n=1 Tax=Photinus pyralis TaxID=7054 RepID=A0A1Y1NL68_PHOPY